jgi:hypothetical protein
MLRSDWLSPSPRTAGAFFSVPGFFSCFIGRPLIIVNKYWLAVVIRFLLLALFFARIKYPDLSLRTLVNGVPSYDYPNIKPRPIGPGEAKP